LRQILINLVSNAAKFTREGAIEIQAAREGSNVCISVRDTGPGIAAEDHQRIFEPFVQLSGAESEIGAGLGLAIAQQLAQRMGGGMSLESALGKGSTFFLRLPAAEAATGDRRRESSLRNMAI
jgi:signal transduction histidine kinase